MDTTGPLDFSQPDTPSTSDFEDNMNLEDLGENFGLPESAESDSDESVAPVDKEENAEPGELPPPRTSADMVLENPGSVRFDIRFVIYYSFQCHSLYFYIISFPG